MASASTPLPTPPEKAPRKRSPPNRLLAALLTLLAPGAGHVYAASLPRALGWGLGTLAALVLNLVMARSGRAFLPTIGLTVVGLYGGSAIDAWRVAARSPERESTLRILFLSLALLSATRFAALLVRAFLLEAFKIPSGSMIPTLAIGDHLFVDKARRNPGRGDVIVFPSPEHPDQAFVKRVIALPGDRIEFDHSHPILNGVPVSSCKVGSYSYEDRTDPDSKHDGDLFVERVDAHLFFALYDHAAAGADHQGPWTVGPGEVFVLGDNRLNSYDSRMWLGGKGGGLPTSTVLGIPFAVWLSIEDDGVDWTRTGAPLDDLGLPRDGAALAPEVKRCVKELGK
jgi:signal peptidase I